MKTRNGSLIDRQPTHRVRALRPHGGRSSLLDLASSDHDAAMKATHALWCGLCHQHAYISSAALPAYPFILEVLDSANDDLAVEILDILLGFGLANGGLRTSPYEWERNSAGNYGNNFLDCRFGQAPNDLGHFLLTNLSLEDLKRSAPARVITVSSELHNPAYAGGPKPDFDYDNLRERSTTTPRSSTGIQNWLTYGSHMNCNAGLRTGVTSNAVCPGFVPAAIAARRKSAIERLFYAQVMTRMPFRVHWSRLPSPMFAASNPALKGLAGSSSLMAKRNDQATSPS